MSFRKVPQSAAADQKEVSSSIGDQATSCIDLQKFSADFFVCAFNVIRWDAYPVKGLRLLHHFDQRVNIQTFSESEKDDIWVGKCLILWIADDYRSLFEVYLVHFDLFWLYLHDMCAGLWKTGAKICITFEKYNNMETVEKAVAKSLMDIKAVMLRPETPFTWASGWNSPIYCDNRKILSYPEIRENVCRWMADIIKEKYPEVEVIAGVATGAIAHGYLVAHILGKPFCYVRPKPKDHGTGSQIEGLLPEGAKVVIVEDLISTGMSSLAAQNALVKAGADVMGMVAIFSYNFNHARKAFEEANVELTTLSNYDTLIEVAAQTGYVKESEIAVLKEWRVSPSTWGK